LESPKGGERSVVYRRRASNAAVSRWAGLVTDFGDDVCRSGDKDPEHDFVGGHDKHGHEFDRRNVVGGRRGTGIDGGDGVVK
jgi:hypothetical protein